MASAPSRPNLPAPATRTRLKPALSDLLLAAVLAGANIAQVLLTSGVDRSRPVLIGLSVLTTLPVAWRRIAPEASAWAFGVFFAALLTGDYPDFIVGTLVAAVLIPYSLGAGVDSLSRSVAPLLLIIGGGAIDDVRLHHPAGQYLASVFLLGVPWALARLLKAQREQADRLARLTRELEVERDRTAHVAVMEERNRIARELHDLVAHSISVIAIQSAGAEAALTEDAEGARRPLRLIQRTSREALMEMRRLLHMLRASDGVNGQPQPGLADLPALLDQARADGSSVTLELDGDAEVPRTLDVNAYRIVQECLTNVRKHAGDHAAAHVLIERLPEQLRIVVRDDGVGMRDSGSAGHGLLGIRERARLFGGTMTAGDDAEQGFKVEVDLPVRSVAEDPAG
jgi:signal transduction histidine kinase